MSRLTAFYERFIVREWYMKWSVWLACLAVVGPEILQTLSQNIDLFFVAVPQINDSTKATIRLVMLCLIPLVRAIKQKQPEDSQ